MKSRLLRYTIVWSVVFAAGYFAISPVLFPRSIEAIINAPIEVVRAPIEGRISSPSIRTGQYLRHGMKIADIANERVDEKFLLEMNNNIATATADIRSLDSQSHRLEEQLQQLRELVDASNRNAIERLTSQLGQKQLDIQSQAVERDLLVEEAHRAERLADQQIKSGAEAIRALREAEIASYQVDMAREEAEELKLRIRALQQKLITDFDPSMSTLRMRENEVAERLAQKRSEREALMLSIAQYEQSAHAEKLRTERLRQVDLTAPVEGRVWQVAMTDSEFVQEGDTLIEVANCAAEVVTATVTGRVFNAISLGQDVTFVAESDRVHHQGVIVEMSGPASRVDSVRYAIRPSSNEKKEFRIAVRLHEESRDPEACGIGRTGKIVFDSRFGSQIELLTAGIKNWIDGIWMNTAQARVLDLPSSDDRSLQDPMVPARLTTVSN
ncbi:MAG: HlyD family efflux transporter periplasmic adaptor subunit [Rhizobium sp.]|nr:HlyD family efflux transporter periplasmic adaptor subunit [Rhizobium sp.]